MNVGTWNVTSLTGKEVELVEEVKKYRLDIVSLSSTKKRGNGIVVLQDGWQLLYSEVEPSTHAQSGVGLLISLPLIDAVIEWKPINERAALLRLQLPMKTQAVIQVYAPNVESNYPKFLDNVSQVLESIPTSNSILLMGDFNTHIGNDSITWKGVIGPNDNKNLNSQRRLLLDFCSNSGLSIMNTYKDIYKYT